MRKALMPLVASLALCGGMTGLLIATNANAQQAVTGLLLTSTTAQAPAAKRPVMLALAQQDQLGDDDTAAPPSEGGGPGMMMERGQRRARFCKVMYARKVGELAFLETKLALTPAQAPAFARWKQVSLDTAHSHEAACTDRPARHADGKRPTVLDRMAMEEKMLKGRLADLQAERPALETLYAALTPEQRKELGHGGMRHPMMGRMMGAMMGRGPMGHGPMGRGPDGAPPPPQ